MQSDGVPLIVAWLVIGFVVAAVLVQAVLDYWPELSEWWRKKGRK